MSDNGLDLLAQRQRASEQADLANQQSAPAPIDDTVKVDPIKALALEKALNHAAFGAEAGAVVDTAKTFEQYLRGDDSNG
jgi:hypothetical protein